MLGKGLLYPLGLLSLAGWGALGTLIAYSSPERMIARFLVFMLLFVSMFFSSVLLAHYLSFRIAATEWSLGEFRVSIVCGIPPAVAATVAVWLQSLRALSVVSAVILFCAVLLVEVAVLVGGRKDRGSKRVQKAGR